MLFASAHQPNTNGEQFSSRRSLNSSLHIPSKEEFRTSARPLKPRAKKGLPVLENRLEPRLFPLLESGQLRLDDLEMLSSTRDNLLTVSERGRSQTLLDETLPSTDTLFLRPGRPSKKSLHRSLQPLKASSPHPHSTKHPSPPHRSTLVASHHGLSSS